VATAVVLAFAEARAWAHSGMGARTDLRGANPLSFWVSQLK
jgi:hypothetical protein